MPDDQRTERSPDERAADHAAIGRLGSELLPALIAKLGATGLGELEVREGDWRVRLRRPASSSAGSAAASSRERGAERRRDGADRPGGGASGERSSRGHHALDGTTTARTETRSVATSPAVGIYRPRADLVAGTKVRAGDRLGAVDMLGIAQEVVAPVDGILGAALAESGDAVEYGQELLVIEFAPAAASSNGKGDV